MRMYLKSYRGQYAKLVQFKDSSVLLGRDEGPMLLFVNGCYSNIEHFVDQYGNQIEVRNRNTDQEEILEIWAEYKCMRKENDNIWKEDYFQFRAFLNVDLKTDWRTCEVSGKRTQAEFVQMVFMKPLKLQWKEYTISN